MAYDAGSGTVVMFGGNAPGRYLNDTWTWNGRTWTRQHPAASPSARDGAAMAYDADTRTAVLFGGVPDVGTGELGDTWAWG
jgi:hypothetical protein